MSKTSDLERREQRDLKGKRAKILFPIDAKSRYLSSFVLLQKEVGRTGESV